MNDESLDQLYRDAARDYDRRQMELAKRMRRQTRKMWLGIAIGVAWFWLSSCVDWPTVLKLAAVGEAIVIIFKVAV